MDFCEPLNLAITPSARTEAHFCTTCGELLTLEMEFEPPFVCVDCMADMAGLHPVTSERNAS